ncbi:MAG: efflux RND transporter periplasmic adaptor subunit [Archangiaceae bacterium]|nr:efflux RND transporter periplasmic adaptor subunit [Archangiaceae bacterium]
MKPSSRWLIAVLALSGCKKAEPAESAGVPAGEHRDEQEHGELPSQLAVTPEIAREAGIETQVVKRAALANAVALPGEIAAEPDRTARVSTVTSGTLEQVDFNEGSTVKKGDVLAVLRVPDVGRLRGALAATTAKAKAARANTERLRALRESGLGAEQAVVDAEAETHAQESEARALGEQLQAIGATAEVGGFRVPLRAPISGSVVSRDAVVGQPISADRVLATVVDLTEVWFLGRVFEKDLGRLRVGARCEVQLNAFPSERFEGTVDHVGQQTDPVARTLTARIRLANPAGKLRLGLFGTAHVEVAEANGSSPQMVVPRGAVAEVGKRSVVFVKAKDGDFVVHAVTLGDAALGQVQVLSGLDEGEEVAVRGVFTLKSMLLKATLSEDEH